MATKFLFLSLLLLYDFTVKLNELGQKLRYKILYLSDAH